MGNDDRQPTKFHAEIIYGAIAYVHALRHHLRDSSPCDEPEQFPPVEDLQHLDESSVPELLRPVDDGLV